MEQLLLITDLDGSLLDRNKQIPPNALRAIERFVDAGGLFTVATGRTEDTCRIAADLLPINVPAVLYNGASVMALDKRQVLYDRTLDAAAFRPLVTDLIGRFPALCVQIFAYGPAILVNRRQIMDPFIQQEGQPYRWMLLEETPPRWLKMMFSGSPALLQEAAAYLETVRDGYPPYTGFFSLDIYYEILPANCTKGGGVRWLAESLGIPRERVAVLGDHQNDLDMLAWAGHAFVPANAHPDVKAAAQVLPLTNDEGAAALAVEQLLG